MHLVEGRVINRSVQLECMRKYTQISVVMHRVGTQNDRVGKKECKNVSLQMTNIRNTNSCIILSGTFLGRGWGGGEWLKMFLPPENYYVII